jgi:ribonuclease P protein component
VQAGFSVPKKKFKSSVHRHRIRRLVVESWRLHKHLLYEAVPADKQVHLFFVFTGKEMPEYEPVKEAVIKAVGQLITRVQPVADADAGEKQP